MCYHLRFNLSARCRFGSELFILKWIKSLLFPNQRDMVRLPDYAVVGVNILILYVSYSKRLSREVSGTAPYA